MCHVQHEGARRVKREQLNREKGTSARMPCPTWIWSLFLYSRMNQISPSVKAYHRDCIGERLQWVVVCFHLVLSVSTNVRRAVYLLYFPLCHQGWSTRRVYVVWLWLTSVLRWLATCFSSNNNAMCRCVLFSHYSSQECEWSNFFGQPIMEAREPRFLNRNQWNLFIFFCFLVLFVLHWRYFVLDQSINKSTSNRLL